MGFNKKTVTESATFKNILLVGFVWLTLALFILPEAKRQNRLCANGADDIGAMFLYTPEQAYDLMERFGQKGRLYHIAIELSADNFYALAASVLAYFLLIWSGRVAEFDFPKTEHLVGLALLIFTAHLLENISTVGMLMAYPKKQGLLFHMTSFFALSKYLAMAVSLAIIGRNLVFFDNRKFTTKIASKGSTTESKLSSNFNTFLHFLKKR